MPQGERQRSMLTCIEEASERTTRNSPHGTDSDSKEPDTGGYDYLQSVIASDSKMVRNDEAKTGNDSSEHLHGSAGSWEDPNRVSFETTSSGQKSLNRSWNKSYSSTLSNSANSTTYNAYPHSNRSARLGDSVDSIPKSNLPNFARRRFSMAYRSSDEVLTFPHDCFSFLILHGPIESPRFFWFGCLIAVLQLGFLILALLSIVHPDWAAEISPESSDNPSVWFFFPSNVTGLIKATQIFAVVSYILFADMSIKDYLTAIQLFPQYSKLDKGDKYWCMVFSCVVRGTMGFLTMIVTIMILLTHTSVIDIILDFLAMNFIGDLGKMAFQLCLWGKYGRRLEEEARRIEDLQLPRCMIRCQTQRRYNLMIAPVFVIAVGVIMFLLLSQGLDDFWSTKIFRIQFVDNPDLEPYSGCYREKEFNTGFITSNNRLNYESFEGNPMSAAMEYDDSRWALYSSNGKHPFDATNANKVVESSSTRTYDIKGVQSSIWSDMTGTPINLYFFSGSEDEIEETCNSFMNDGICDDIFNNFERGYDGGDCCASTCTKSNCGAGTLESAFGTSVYGDGFPKCFDPSMVPITIKVENIIDSWTYAITDDSRDSNESGGDSYVPHVRISDPPPAIEPIMMLDCDDKNILAVPVNQKMAGQMQTVMVEDGANCTIRINNFTSSSMNNEKPIWFVNYTVYHGNTMSVEQDPIVILREQSANNEYANFARIQECYFDKLADHIDTSTMYTGTGSQNEAIEWLRLASRYSRNSVCDDDYFLERYALSVLNFAAPIKSSENSSSEDSSVSLVLPDSITTIPGIQEVARIVKNQKFSWTEDTRQCIWHTVSCNEHSVGSLNLRRYELDGTIAPSIGILTNLITLDIADNRFRDAIPSEIGILTSLNTLRFANNFLNGTIPSEIGNMVALEVLNVADNDLTGTIPTEIGLLTSMKKLNFTGNSLSSTIPSEIGALSALEELDLRDNSLTGKIPNELGILAKNHNLTKVYVANNLALIMMGEPEFGLRDVVYTECFTDGCLPKDEVVSLDPCQVLMEEYEGNRMELPIDKCERLKSDCLVCI